MTKRLEKAFAEAAKLPEVEQDALARWLLEELASDRRWDELFSKSHDRVAEMAEEALDEHHEKKTRQLRPGDL